MIAYILKSTLPAAFVLYAYFLGNGPSVGPQFVFVMVKNSK